MPDMTEKIIRAIEQTIADLKEENRIYSGAINFTDPDYYDDQIEKNNDKIKRLQAIIEQYKKATKSDDDEKKVESDKVRADLQELKDKLYNYRMDAYTLKGDYSKDEEDKLISAIKDYVKAYKGILTPKEIENINAEYDVNKRIKNELGEELTTFAEEYLIYYRKILSDLKSAAYGTEDYEKARSRFETFLSAANKLNGKNNISVSFDEDTQVFAMDFDGKLPAINDPVVNTDTLEEIKKATKKKNEPDDAAKMYETRFRALVDDEIAKIDGHFKKKDELLDFELIDIFHQAPKREDYAGLNDIEAENIETMMRGYRFDGLTKAFGMDLAYIVEIYLEILSIKEELSIYYPDEPEFQELLDRIKTNINQIKLYNGEDIKVEFNEETYVLTVSVKDGKIGDITVPEEFINNRVVSPETLGTIKKENKSEKLNREEQMLKNALTQPSIKYMMWYEKKLTRHEDFDTDKLFIPELRKLHDVASDSRFDGISEERKIQIIDQIIEDREKDLQKKYGKELYKLLEDFIDYKEYVETLKGAKYGTKEFEDAFKKVQGLISRAQKVAGVTVNYNEDLQRLSISFGHPNVDAITDIIVSPEALEEMNKSKKPKGSRSDHDIEEQFKADLKEELRKFKELSEKVFKTHKYDDSVFEKIDKEIDDFIDAYKGVSTERKKEIERELYTEIKDEWISKYGKELYDLLRRTLIDFDEIVADLNAATYGTREFEIAKKKFDNTLAKIKSTPGVTVNYNEDNQNVSIVFANPEIDPIYATAMSKEAIEAMNKDKGGKGPETKPEPKPEHKDTEKPDKNIQSAIDEYVARVSEINNMVDELERINIFQDLSIDPLSSSYMDKVIENEKIAREYETLINRNRLELSKYRMDFTKKYGKYIFSYPEVKNTPIKEVNYKESLEDITKKIDEIIIRAEYERTRDNISETEITKLNEYIDAQNAMISRRLINRAANDSSFDSKAYLDSRRKDKQAQRKQILQKEKGPEFIENYTIKGSTLNFNPAVKDKIDTSKAVVISATDQINVELYKSRIVIKMTKQVKDRLAKLKTAIKLTNEHGKDQVINVSKNKAIEFGTNGENLTGLGLEIVSQDPSISDEAMYSMDLEELKSRSK